MTESRATAAEIAGPIAGKPAAGFANYDLLPLGYLEEEYVISGEAQAYDVVGERSADGRWRAEPGARARYRSRFIVRRPAEPSRFNGTVLVEWLNVSGGMDADPDWGFMHRHIIRDGFAWVGVSAQKAGIDGGGLVDGPNLKRAQPHRYGHLEHPGDAYAYDIFSQVGRLFRVSDGPRLLGPLDPDVLIAVGESQSAAFLVTYINAVDPLAHVFDGFLVHGRGASGADMDGFRLATAGGEGIPDLDAARAALRRSPERIRDDVRVPVLTVQSETDVTGMSGALARQPDNARFRLWEIAGSAHGDTYILVAAHTDTGQLRPEELAALLSPSSTGTMLLTDHPVNGGPQQHYVIQSALDGLHRWVRDGTPPPEADRLELDHTGDRFVVDDLGVARGGIRTPWVDAPVATLTGTAPAGGPLFAFLFGSTAPFDAAQLAAVYPGGRAEYLGRFGASLDEAIAKGFILEVDREEIRALAAVSYPEPG